MRAVKKSLKNIPDSLESQDSRDHIRRIWNNGDPNKDLITSEYYRADDVVTKLKNLYYSKCAYCEQYEPQFQVEHYRPKKRVQRLDLKHGEVHSGYYWLTNEWSNLVPACDDCNKTGVKGNRFPISQNRRENPTTIGHDLDFATFVFESDDLLTYESPLLLHPEESGFRPSEYFKFDSYGVVREKANPGTLKFRRAQATIEVVGLNRDKLKLEIRKNGIRSMGYQLKGIFLNFLNDRENISEQYAHKRLKDDFFKILKNLENKIKPSQPYSFFWNYLYQNIDLVLRTCLKPKFRSIFIELSQEYKNKNL